MSGFDPRPRVLLAGHLFREGVRALALSGKPSPVAKERLLAAVELATWELPADAFVSVDSLDEDAWVARMLADVRVRAALEAAVKASSSP